MAQNTSLNNTLEEELRLMLVQKNECNLYREEIKILKRSVAEEQEGKYRAYIKIADLQKANPQKY